MDYATLKAEIENDPACAQALLERDCKAIAAIRSTGRTRYAPKGIGEGSVMSALGAVRGAAVLDALEAMTTQNNVIRRAWGLLQRGALDIGDATTHEQLNQLVAGGLMTATEAAKLTALALVPDPLSVQDVARALYGTED